MLISVFDSPKSRSLISYRLLLIFQVTFTIDGDSLVEKQKADGFECTHVRKGDGTTLVMVGKPITK